jgi:formylglycine-generating enzyme required for sulfatase activity
MMKTYLLLIASLILLLSSCQVVDLNSPIPIYDTGVDPAAWASIPAGGFLWSQHNEPTLIDYDYSMMVTDVTNTQYADYLNAALASVKIRISGEQVVGYYPGDVFHAARHEENIAPGDYAYLPLNDPALRLNFDGGIFTVKRGYENHPATMVSWFGAKAYCEANGWRLPSEMEWEKAARGGDGRPFPWGDEIERQNANFYSSRDPFEDMRSAGSRTTPVGFYNGHIYDGYQTIASPSPYGLYDMAGNVWQWSGDVYAGQHYRYMRGGSKDTYAYNLRIWMRNNANPTYYSPGVGFRCARDQ